MFRPPTASKSGVSNNSTSSTNAISSSSLARQNNNENSPTTIREIRSRTVVPAASSNTRHLLANRRKAMSMERLNSVPATVVSTVHNSNNEKGSPSSGSSNSINGSTNSSPLRGGLNRTASRVSRFRSAKAVFERLSSANNAVARADKPAVPDKVRGTVASRYAAAAAARATTHANLSSSPRSRTQSGSLVRSQDSGKSASNSDIHINSHLSKFDASHPKPLPRVVTTRVAANSAPAIDTKAKGRSLASTSSLNKNTAQPPPKDLLDEIVFEIARDATKQAPDANCTIQDLSNCDISGIPETLDFERCFQDVEMMTEEEARKLLSRKPNSSPPPADISVECPAIELKTDLMDCIEENAQDNVENTSHDATPTETSNQSGSFESTITSSAKCKVRFSEEPVKVFNTHAVEDYDRRNDDIDPVAASAEYELEKSREREGLRDSDDEDLNDVRAVKTSDNFIQQRTQDSNNLDNLPGVPQNLQNAPRSDPRGSLYDDAEQQLAEQKAKDEEGQANNKEYIESLEREVNLKRILEQNLRDLQSQYYEAVKDLDDYKNVSETKVSSLEQNLSALNGKLESSQNELTDAREQSNELEKQLNDIKESSQLLEKKYHRAKRIIKDMQSREQSFTRREQLYQQKLDEIEFELGRLIDSVDKTIYEDGLKFFSILDNASCQRQHQVRLDVFGLIRQMLNNFNVNQSTQNPQIKQRVVSILEQQLANLMALTNGSTTIARSTAQPISSANGISSDNSQQEQLQVDSNKHSQNQSYQLSSHRLSQPNLPHPIGVSGHPTKLFHALNPLPPQIPVNEPSPPQSVNSYPSTNSLNSLNNNNNSHNINNNNNNNNNNSNTNNNNIIMTTKLREQQSISDLQLGNIPSIVPSTKNMTDDKFQPALDIQVPYQTNEWHDKPVSEWTTTQVSTWLLALGLDQYISKFEDRNVNGQSLINLDSTVLKGLGVLNSNDRNLLKKKIRELRLEMEKERKQIEKKLKENLKDKSKNKVNNVNNRNTDDKSNSQQQNKPSWKKSLLS